MNPRHCPLFTTDFGMIRGFFESLPLDELIFQTEQMFNKLSSAEKITYDITRFCSDYSDIDGRIAFIRALFDNAVFSSVHIPLDYQRNPRLIDLVRTKRYEYYIPVARELAKEVAALTDDIDTAPTTTITVTNPRWVHVDEGRKEASPAIAAVGDTVELLVDVKDYPEGAPVTFDIFDSSSDPAMRIETERGKNEGGTAKITWKVCDPNERSKDLKLEFEGRARSKSSGRAPIDLKIQRIYRVDVKDDGDNPLKGVKVEFTVPGKEPVIVQTDENGIAELPAEDPTVDAEARILWEEPPNEPAQSGDIPGEENNSTEELSASGTSIATEETGATAEDAALILSDHAGDKIAKLSIKGYEAFIVDDKGNLIGGAKVSFRVDGKETTVTTDEKGRAFLEQQGSSTSPAEVRVSLG